MIQIFKAAIWFLCIHETDVGVILHLRIIFKFSSCYADDYTSLYMNVHIQVPPSDNQEKYFYYSSAPLIHKLKL